MMPRHRRDTREALIHLTRAVESLTAAVQRLRAEQEQFNRVHQETLQNWLAGMKPTQTAEQLAKIERIMLGVPTLRAREDLPWDFEVM